MRRQHAVVLLLTGSALAAGLLLLATAARALPSIETISAEASGREKMRTALSRPLK